MRVLRAVEALGRLDWQCDSDKLVRVTFGTEGTAIAEHPSIMRLQCTFKVTAD